MALLLILGFLVLIAIGMPIALSLTTICTITIIVDPELPMNLMAAKLFTGTDVFILLALPFFILAGQIMYEGGVARRVIHIADTAVGSITGGLAHINVVASMFFAGISGAAVADTAALGPLEIPMMINGGYSKANAASVTAISSVIGIIIPPSIPMIMYALASETSVIRLFLGGMVPGILIGLSLMIINYIYAKRNGWVSEHRFSLKRLIDALKDGAFALVMPLIIIGGILGGIFTATEAGIIAVIYGLIIAKFVHRELPNNRFPSIFSITVKQSASITSIMFIIASASLYAWLLTYFRIPMQVYKLMISLTANKTLLILMVVGIYVIAGFIMDLGANIIILVPMFMPLVNGLGIDKVHFGLITVSSLAIGLITPPVAVCTIVASQIAGVTIMQVTKSAIPYLAAILVVLMMIVFVPGFTLWIPNLLMH